MIWRFSSDTAKRACKKLGWSIYPAIPGKSNLTLGDVIDRSRHQADAGSKYSLYFELLRNKISQYNIEPCNTYNIDKKGFFFGAVTRSKRVFSKRLYEEEKFGPTIQDGDREWITLLVCICTDGSALDPRLVAAGWPKPVSDLCASFVLSAQLHFRTLNKNVLALCKVFAV